MWWPWSKASAYGAAHTGVEQRSASWSISDPAMVELLGVGGAALAGMTVSENSALGLSAVYRAVSLIAGTIASLPMRTIETNKDGHTERASSFLDTPGGPVGFGPTAFEWKEQVLVHLLLHGNAYCVHLYGGAGQIVGLQPIHPLAVSVDMQDDGSKLFTVSLTDGTKRVFTAAQLTHIPAMSTDGVQGLSPIAVARNVFGTAMAGENAAANMFKNGAMVGGLVSADDDLSADEALVIRNDLRQKIQGVNNVGDVVLINRKLKFDRWSMSAEDSQFLQQRAFSVEEIARWYGVPNHLLGQAERSTTWGSGLTEINRGLARFTLEPWTTRIQERLSRLLTGGKKCEFDYSAFVQPDPETEISLLIQQVDAGLLTVNEARKIRNLPPLPGGDEPRDTEDDEPRTETEDSNLGVLQRFGPVMTLPEIGTPTTNGVDHG